MKMVLGQVCAFGADSNRDVSHYTSSSFVSPRPSVSSIIVLTCRDKF